MQTLDAILIGGANSAIAYLIGIAWVAVFIFLDAYLCHHGARRINLEKATKGTLVDWNAPGWRRTAARALFWLLILASACFLVYLFRQG